MISIKQLNYALAVAKRLHFKKAADDCFVSPSTLSNAITELENQIGFQIFERTNKKVIVTKLGLDLLKKAEAIQHQIEDIKNLGEKQKAPLSSSLTIGIIPTIGPYLLPLVLPRLKKQHPNLNLKILEGKSNISNDKPGLILPEYTRVDFGMDYKITDDLSVQLNIENLTDELYFPHSHSTHQASVGEPFNARISIRKTF
jgi:DNA-binding transcriptional LysR family regulator